jgi:hypothetical protein
MPAPLGREESVTVHVTPDMKKALQSESRKSRVSVSRLAYLWLLERLRRKGHPINDEPQEEGRWTPQGE